MTHMPTILRPSRAVFRFSGAHAQKLLFDVVTGRLLAEPERLKGMQSAARKMGRPNAAETVIHTLLSDPEHEAIHVDEEKQEAMAESVRKR